MDSNKHDEISQTPSIASLIEGLEGGTPHNVWDAIDTLGTLADSAVPELIRALKTSTARHLIASILGQIRDTRAVLPLMDLLSTDTYDQARYAAALALGQLGDKRATKFLVDALDDPDPAMRHIAASALGDLQNEAAIPRLIGALRDPDWELRRQAAYSLGQIGSSQALQPLMDALYDDCSDVREWAALGLGILGREEAIERLTEVQETDTGETFEGHKVSSAAGQAIGAIKNKLAETRRDPNLQS
jgi:HEAT repeat protein